MECGCGSKLLEKGMVERREIGAGLADALIAEYDRRVQNNTLHGFLPLLTFIAKK